MLTALAVAAAGAGGALVRYALGLAAGPLAWPWLTLGINVLGSFLLALLLTAGTGRLPAELVTALAVGALGAFTTYSTFSVEVLTLLRAGRHGAAAGYVAASLAGGLLAAYAGWRTGTAVIGGAVTAPGGAPR